MTFLRTAIVVVLLNLPIHAQPTPTSTDATVLINKTSAVVFMTINNPSMYDIYIVSGKSESAESIAFMETSKDGDKAITSLTVPAYGSIELKPAERRIRLSGLKGQFKEGDELKLTLETDGGASIEVAAIVKAVDQ
jgi:copper(I)-binding protein